MQLKRFISTANVKNTYLYINSQKIYEVIRTICYFAVSISLFIAGYVATDSNVNLLTVVAVLGCLPASKSLVSVIMFCRFKSCSEMVHDKVCTFDEELDCLYDLVFTTEKKTFFLSHAAYKSKCLILFSEKNEIDTVTLEAHITEYLKRASIAGIHVKVYTEVDKYLKRLSELVNLTKEDNKLSQEVLQLLKEITL